MTEKEEKKTENSYKSFKDALVIHRAYKSYKPI